MNQEIPKVYSPAEVEQKWYKFWEENRFFTPEEDSSKKPFVIVIPPPNITGNLHMGHALDNSIQDVLIRYKKLQGFNTLWLPGTDHAGIATQNVVAKALKKEGTSKDQLGREKFVERVWKWKEEYGGNITRQLRRLGCALDWTRERFTLEEGLSKAVTREFVTLYNEGLIYRGKRLVNWCPKCGTAISDIEVEHETKKGRLWWIKYPIEGKSEIRNSKSEQGIDYITVATTRPETMLGDTAVAVNSKDKRYKKLIGKMLILPLVNRRIPIIKDDFVDPEFGTGAVKVTPAHDPNDFEIGERHELPRVNILTPDAKITFEQFVEEEKKEVTELEGMDRYKARQRLVELLEERGFLGKIEEYETSIGHCYRCKDVVEPYLSDQWYVKVKDIAREAIKAVEDGKIKYVPDRWTKVYINWMVNLKDWCISRQLWWGHRIPVWYHGEEVYVGEDPPKGEGWEQDPDVFDTWFSSALWPFSTLGWPEETKDLKTFYPTDVLVTGYDIITFWVSRMIMMGVHFMKKEPFHTVFIHGLVRDAKGKKMSKSFGNVIDPLEIIDKIGADALRFALISLITGQGQDIKLTQDKITEARNFSNKIWNVSRFVLMNLDKKIKLEIPDNLELPDRWIISRYQNLTKEVTDLIDDHDLGEAARKLYEFLWGSFCDWYIEISKNDLYSNDSKKKEKTQRVLVYVLEGTLRLLHPFMPFITEEIWQLLISKTNAKDIPKSIFLSSVPEYNKTKVDPKSEKEMSLLIEMIIKIRNIKAEMGIQTKEVELCYFAPKREEKETIQRGEAFIKSLGRVTKSTWLKAIKERPQQSATGVASNTQFFMPLKGLVDINIEVGRLKKEEQKVGQVLANIKKLLSNNNFTSKAPPEAVEKERAREKELIEKKKIISARLKDLAV
ncbi:MAG: valine--tRNA ligase [Candidatus Margulisiibacteriota bacterium]